MFESKSPSLCAVSDWSHFHLDRRLTWGETKESAIAEVREAIGPEAEIVVPIYKKASYKGTTFEQEKYFPTWKLPENSTFVQNGVAAHEALFGSKPRVDKWTFSTNGVAISGKHGIPCIGFGPGNEVFAHAPNEAVEIDHLVTAAAFYAMLPFVMK